MVASPMPRCRAPRAHRDELVQAREAVRELLHQVEAAPPADRGVALHGLAHHLLEGELEGVCECVSSWMRYTWSGRGYGLG